MRAWRAPPARGPAWRWTAAVRLAAPAVPRRRWRSRTTRRRAPPAAAAVWAGAWSPPEARADLEAGAGVRLRVAVLGNGDAHVFARLRLGVRTLRLRDRGAR